MVLRSTATLEQELIDAAAASGAAEADLQSLAAQDSVIAADLDPKIPRKPPPPRREPELIFLHLLPNLKAAGADPFLERTPSFSMAARANFSEGEAWKNFFPIPAVYVASVFI